MSSSPSHLSLHHRGLAWAGGCLIGAGSYVDFEPRTSSVSGCRSGSLEYLRPSPSPARQGERFFRETAVLTHIA